jgi:hypothetical protein
MSQIALDSTARPPRRDLARRALGKGARLGAAASDRLLAPLTPLVCPDVDDDIPAVFVVGCPRSGSTLFYQAMVQSFRFAYISNDVAHFPRSGPLVARLLRANRRMLDLEFSSSYGDTHGGAGPSEAGAFWDLAFPRAEEHTVEAEAWPDDRRRFVRRHLAGFVDLYDAPFLCKNLWHSVRIEALHRAFPSAAFIIMRRDLMLVAQSILQQQRTRLARQEGFWSIRPRGLAAKMHLPLPQQVAWQVVLTEQAIADARDRVDQSRFLELPYEDFCDRPESWMEQVGGFLQGLGIDVHRRAAIGRRFVAHRHCSLPVSEREQVDSVLRAA